MLRVFENLGSIGLVTDQPVQKLPPAAWTDASNVRFQDGRVKKMTGHSTYLASPNASDVYYVLGAKKSNSKYTIYHSGDKLYSYDGTTSTDITPADDGSFFHVDPTGDTHAFLPGGVIVINNEEDLGPVYTVVGSSVPVVQRLPAWPTLLKTSLVRSYKNFLFAMSNEIGGAFYPEQIRWSNRADPGAPPSSWDETDTTQPTGIATLPFEGFIMDAAELRDSLIIYQENHIYQLDEIGGASIFSLRRIFQGAGAANKRCVVPIKEGHVVLGSTDIYYHDGSKIESIVEDRVRKSIFSEFNIAYNPYVFTNSNQSEVWFCIPTQSINDLGSDTAWVWDYSNNTWSKRDIPNSLFAAEIDIGGNYKSNLKTPILASLADNSLLKLDDTEQFAGTNMTAYVERRCLPLGERGEMDLRRMKYVREITPQITGTAGGVVNVYVGRRDSIDGTRTWEGPFPYTIGTTRKIDCRVSGRVIDIKFESTTNITWELTEYGVDYRLSDARR